MSTKATIAHGPNFHLYHEVMDEDFVYLELEGVQFEASYQRVMVPIPVHIWEAIRHYSGIDLSFADKTDDELRHYVERQVDERITAYREAAQENRPRVSLRGSLAYGSADLPRDQQVEEGMRHFTRVREHQRQIARAIAELERTNARNEA